MSKITSKETKPERVVRKFLFSKGFYYRKNVRKLPGSPDVVLPKYKTVIFVNGCFWHGHTQCRAAKLPSSRRDFWQKKISENKKRDKRNMKELEQLGYKLIVIWQCEINNEPRKEKRLKSLLKEIEENK